MKNVCLTSFSFILLFCTKIFSVFPEFEDIFYTPAGTQRWNNIDIESTLNRRCFNVLYPLGIFRNVA